MTSSYLDRLYNFTWYTYSEKPRLHQQRDLGIFVQLLPMLLACGFKYVDTMLNYAFDKRLTEEKFDFKFKDSDLIFISTRPPIRDKHQKDRRRIYRTGHFLEAYFLCKLKEKFFQVCSRSHIKLKKPLAKKLPNGFMDRAEIQYRVNRSVNNRSADYSKVKAYHLDGRTLDFNGNKSSAFLIYIAAAEGMPAILSVFGIGGQEGLIISRILQDHLWENLNIDLKGSSRFIMFELDTKVEVASFQSLAAVEKMEYKILLDEKF